ncbi:MAG TPA: threonine/serine exporter family protein, partial [Silvibacterium sp.]|nr:threonine/serine exporter family protein [Silvibacterium sp.]
MSNADAGQRRSPLPREQPLPTVRPGKRLDQAVALDLLSTSARLLFGNGQTTERMVAASEQLAEALGFRAGVFPRWGELVVRIEDDAGSHYEIVAAEPAGVDMRKVTATMAAIDKVCDGRMDAAAMQSGLETITRLPPISIARFALLAAAGAAALGVIFGTAHLLSLVLIALSAGAGACLRRWLAGMSRNLFVQPFCAALLAGVAGAIAFRLQLSSVVRLIAVCPCMVLVPGPHLLNGMIDLARARIALGAARITYASLIIVVICTGLLLGLAVAAVSLPASGPLHSAPLGYDLIAAGIAVAAYGTFFAMPWRMLPIPILIGMLAHASRWEAISVAGASP